jgi:hypothetical protein
VTIIKKYLLSIVVSYSHGSWRAARRFL